MTHQNQQSSDPSTVSLRETRKKNIGKSERQYADESREWELIKAAVEVQNIKTELWTQTHGRPNPERMMTLTIENFKNVGEITCDKVVEYLQELKKKDPDFKGIVVLGDDKTTPSFSIDKNGDNGLVIKASAANVMSLFPILVDIAPKKTTGDSSQDAWSHQGEKASATTRAIMNARNKGQGGEDPLGIIKQHQWYRIKNKNPLIHDEIRAYIDTQPARAHKEVMTKLNAALKELFDITSTNKKVYVAPPARPHAFNYVGIDARQIPEFEQRAEADGITITDLDFRELVSLGDAIQREATKKGIILPSHPRQLGV